MPQSNHMKSLSIRSAQTCDQGTILPKQLKIEPGAVADDQDLAARPVRTRNRVTGCGSFW